MTIRANERITRYVDAEAIANGLESEIGGVALDEKE